MIRAGVSAIVRSMRFAQPAFLALVAAAVLITGAGAVTQPTKSKTEKAQIVAVAVSGQSLTYAVGDDAKRTECAHVVYWHVLGNGQAGTWRYGKPTNEPCAERPSTGDGISAVAMSDQRSLWVQYAGGNLRDWQLFTATPTRPQPRQLAFVEQDVDLPPPIVLGQGSGFGVPYAVGSKVTFLKDNGAALFKWTAGSPVALLASTVGGPGGAVAAVLLTSGELDLLNGSGSVVHSYTYPSGAVRALMLGPLGVIVQNGTTVEIRKGAQTTATVTLPAQATMVGFGDHIVFYSLNGSIHALVVTSSSQDSLLIAGTKRKPAVAAYDTRGGLVWGTGNAVDWNCKICVRYGP
jgi:hypothetical protein